MTPERASMWIYVFTGAVVFIPCVIVLVMRDREAEKRKHPTLKMLRWRKLREGALEITFEENGEERSARSESYSVFWYYAPSGDECSFEIWKWLAARRREIKYREEQ